MAVLVQALATNSMNPQRVRAHSSRAQYAANMQQPHRAYNIDQHMIRPQDLEWGRAQEIHPSVMDSGQLLVPRSQRPKPWQSKQTSILDCLHAYPVHALTSPAMNILAPAFLHQISHISTSPVSIWAKHTHLYLYKLPVAPLCTP